MSSADDRSDPLVRAAKRVCVRAEPPAALPLTALVPEQAEAALERVESMTVLNANPEELGASEPFTLGAGEMSTTIELAQPPGPDLESLAIPETSPSTVALIVEGIELG